MSTESLILNQEDPKCVNCTVCGWVLETGGECTVCGGVFETGGERVEELCAILELAIGLHEAERVEGEGVDPPKMVSAWVPEAKRLIAKHRSEHEQ